MFSRKSAPTTLTTMQDLVSPGRNFCGHGKSGCCFPSATTVALMQLKAMFRTMPFARGCRFWFDEELLRLVESRPIEIGPVTLFMIRFEKVMFSNRDLAPQRILIGHP